MSKNGKKTKNNRIDYSIVDQIIKANLDISFVDFRKQCNQKMSMWSFYNRKKYLKTGKQYGEKQVAKMITVATILEECAPKESKLASDYKTIAGILIHNPNAVHLPVKNKYGITMSDANFYQFRKKVRVLLSGSEKNMEQQKIASIPKKRKTMYTLLFEKDLNGERMSDETREFLNEFLNELNTKKGMALETVEIISPRHVLEVRAY